VNNGERYPGGSSTLARPPAGIAHVILAFACAGVLMFGCGQRLGSGRSDDPSAPDRRKGDLEKTDREASFAEAPVSSGAADTQAGDSQGLSGKSLEELILTFRMRRGFGTIEDDRFKYVDDRNARERKAAVEGNRRIMDEIRNRQKNKNGLPRSTLMKYRDCTADVFTGLSGPFCTIEVICRTLLGEYADPESEPAYLQEF
jgi:hypothetical protein